MTTKVKAIGRRGVRGTCPSNFRKVSNWPDFDLAVLDKPTRDRIKVLSAAAQMLLDGEPLRVVMQGLPVGERVFQRMMKKALSPKPDGSRIWGYEAFIPWRAQPKRVRTADLKEDLTGTSGYSGVFMALLSRFPTISEGLKDFLVARTRPNDTPRHVLHREFMRLCREVGLGEDDYPFGTKTQGRTALENWFKTYFLTEHYCAYVKAEFGQDAATSVGHSHGDGQANTPGAPFEYWVFDETPIDVHAKTLLPSLLGDYESIGVARGSIVRLISMNPSVNLAWRPVLGDVMGADLAMMLFDALSGQAPPLPTVPDCPRLPGADWVANAFPQLRWRVPKRIYLDNALAHLYDTLQNLVTDLWGGEVKLGIPKNPKERARIESALSKQSRRVTSQVPSTAGTNPKDPRKKKSAVAVEKRVLYEDLVHVLDTYIVNENVTPAESSLYEAPFVRLERLIATKQIDLAELDETRRKAYWFNDPQDRPVHSNPRDGRAPYVNYMYARYSSPKMSSRPNMGGVLRIRGDLRNLQTVMAFEEDGSLFGELYAEGQWGRVPNDLRIRRIFGMHKRAASLSERADDAPLQALFAHLKNGAPTDRRLALQLAYVTHYLSQHVTSELLREWGMTTVSTPAVAANDPPDAPVTPQAESRPVVMVSGSDVVAPSQQEVKSPGEVNRTTDVQKPSSPPGSSNVTRLQIAVPRRR